MQPAGDLSGAEITRFQSVPATWLESLLLPDEDIITDQLKSTFNQHASITTTDFVDPNLILPASDSSPVEYLSQVNSFDDYLSYPLNVEQFRDFKLEELQMEFTTQMDGDQSEMEKIKQDSVPFGVRAKRGFATHPRSIAERARRSRISDRIRKLQELVPNMDKQTNTADTLDEAVEYVKFLQNQIQDLIEHQNKCTCYN